MKKRSSIPEVESPVVPNTELPEGWSQVKLGVVASAIKGKKPVELLTEKSEGAVPYIDIKAFESGSFREYATPALSRVAEKGDILIVWDGARSGLVGKMPDRGAVGSTLAVLQPHTGNQDYLFLFLQASYEQINANVRGTGIPHVDPGILWNLEVPIPPLAEQKRIVAKVEELLARVNAARDRLAKVPVTLKRFRQSVLAAACSGRLTEDWRTTNRAPAIPRQPTANSPGNSDLPEIPEVWQWVRFGDLTRRFCSGTSNVPLSEPSPFPVLRSSSVRQGKIDYNDVRFLTQAQAEKCDAILVEKQLLFTRLSGSIEYVANCAMVRDLAGRRVYFPDRLFCADLKDPQHAKYCEICFGSPVLREGIPFESKSTAGHQRISMGAVTRFWIPFPPLPEQHEIARRVEDLFALADSIEKKVVAGTVRMEKLTQAILAKAFRGELISTEAELAREERRDYEPATILLDSIKAERKRIESAEYKRLLLPPTWAKLRGRKKMQNSAIVNPTYLADILRGHTNPQPPDELWKQ